MDSHKLKLITEKSDTREEGLIAIDTSLQGNPSLEYYLSGKWNPVNNLASPNRMSKLDDLYSHLYYRGWGIGPRFSERDGNLYLHPGLYNSPIPELSGGIKLTGYLPEDLVDDMNQEVNIYYDSLVSSRDFLEGSSVVDLWEYPIEYGGTLNLTTLPLPKQGNQPPIINLGVAWKNNQVLINEEDLPFMCYKRKTGNLTFTPWDENGEWINFQSQLEEEVMVEFQDGRIRLFPESPSVVECLIHHCNVTYEGLI